MILYEFSFGDLYKKSKAVLSQGIPPLTSLKQVLEKCHLQIKSGLNAKQF